MSFLDGAKARLDCVDFDLLLGSDLANVDLMANVRMTFQYPVRWIGSGRQ